MNQETQKWKPTPERKFGWARIHFDDLQTNMNLGNISDYIIYHGVISGTYQIWWCEEINGQWVPVRQEDLPTINTTLVVER